MIIWLYIPNKVVMLIINKCNTINGSKVLILGITFKESYSDISNNSRVIEVVNELKEFRSNVDVYDPWVNFEEIKRECGIELLLLVFHLQPLTFDGYDIIVLTATYTEFKNLNQQLTLAENTNTVIHDIEGILDKNLIDGDFK